MMCENLMLSSNDTRAGLIPGITFGYKSVIYSVVEGLAIYEGCIVLGSAEHVEQVTADVRRSIEEAGDAGRENVQHGVGVTGQSFRWPNRLVPYVIDPALPNLARVTDAISHWTEKTNFTFVERTNDNASQYHNFIHFRPASGCFSDVGMKLGGQMIGLANGCSTGNAIHEIGHAIGLWHEQSREDRDEFVKINWHNIIQGQEHNFLQRITDGDDYGDYDFESVMHYGYFAFSRNGQASIVPLQESARIGQRNGLSDGDIATVRAMYPSGDPQITSPVAGSTLADSKATFVWTSNGAPVQHWWLYLGSTLGASNYFNSGSLGTNLSATAIGLPTDGSPIFVRLWFKTDGGWESTDSQYVATTPSDPEITSPAPGLTLAESKIKFAWSANGANVLEWWLNLGSTLGSPNYFNSGSMGTNLSATVDGLPTNGSPLYVRLWFRTSNVWQSTDFQYTTVTGGVPTFTSPMPNTVLPDSSVTFKWSANGTHVTGYWVYIGSSPGSAEWYNSGYLATSTSVTVSGLPANGSQIHVRFMYLVDGAWQSANFQYTTYRS